MSRFTPTAHDGNFLYNGIFLANPNIDDSQPHPRTSRHELAMQLCPKALERLPPRKHWLPAIRVPSPSDSKKPWHYWAAQLLHYGLPVKKVVRVCPNHAKISLRRALEKDTLAVPKEIREIEKCLRNKWEKERQKYGMVMSAPTTKRKSMSDSEEDDAGTSPTKRLRVESTAPASEPIPFSGLYQISCPTAAAAFSSFDFDLTLARDRLNLCWWATMRLGTWDFIMKLDSGNGYTSLGQTCSLEWRMRNHKTGRRDVGKGEMKFCDEYWWGAAPRSFQGRLWGGPWVGELRFDGHMLDAEPVEDDLRHEWDASFPREA